MNSLQSRVIRAIKLDPTLYQEVKKDEQALSQATLIIIAVSVVTSICLGFLRTYGFPRLIAGLFIALIVWYARTGIVFLVGSYLLPGPQPGAVGYKGLLRVIGFSASPGLIMLLGLIPSLASVVLIVSAFWMFAALVVAVREGFNYATTRRAIGACLIIILIQAVIIKFFFFTAGSPKSLDLPTSNGSILTPR